MGVSVALSDAQSRLGELMDRVESGEDIVIEPAGRAEVRWVPMVTDVMIAAKRVGGQNLLGVTYISPDFDAPISDQELKGWNCRN